MRLLTDSTGAVTDRYDYDAFGNIISQAGSTPNVYLYSGEQNDPNLSLYYLRARYFNVTSGRFVTTDPIDGAVTDPTSLHKYAYANADPVDKRDPSGLFTTTAEAVTAQVIQGVLLTIYLERVNFQGVFAKVKSVVAEQTTGYLYAFDSLRQPRSRPVGFRIPGFNYPSNRPGDIYLNTRGTVDAQYPPTPLGASAFGDPNVAPLHGNYYRIPKATPFPAGLAFIADGADVGGPHGLTHHTIYPTVETPPQQMVDSFFVLPWVWAGMKP